jgi:hypothetical protein
MTNLITVQELAQFRDIGKKYDEDKANEAISLAQQSDLIAILGDFYFDVVENSQEATYSDLMNGSTFEYEENSYIHQGIKKLLADYAYSRYVYMVNVAPSPFGFTTKITNNGEVVDRNILKDITKQAQIDAGYKFKFIEKYILSNPLFSRYVKEKEDTNFFNNKFSVI